MLEISTRGGVILPRFVGVDLSRRGVKRAVGFPAEDEPGSPPSQECLRSGNRRGVIGLVTVACVRGLERFLL